MAKSTREIKRRIKGIGNTRKITKAMELISSTKSRKRKMKLENTRPYYNTVLDSIREILRSVNINHPLLERREVRNALYITLNADRGFAGGYNSNINRLIDNEFRNNKGSVSLITVGRKSRDFFKRRDYNIIESFVGISEEPEFTDAKRIAKIAMDLFIRGEIDEINVVFTEFISTISQEPRVRKLLPSEKIQRKDDNLARAMVDFEPSPEEVLEYLIPKYLESSIYGALIEASASEQSARHSAMKTATDNANELIEELNMTYNRARQSIITMELSEIVSGAGVL